MIVADTDVLIDFLEHRQPGAWRVRRALLEDGVTTTSISRFELLAGARNETSRAAALRLLDAVPCLSVDARAADCAADVRRGLAEVGRDIGTADTLIAGAVLSRGAQLLTRNRRHFERVPGLVLAEI